jgi:hypothetical protein
MSEPLFGHRLPGYVRPFNPEQKQEEALFLQEQQEAEQALFRFIVAHACQGQTSLGVAQTLSRYLGHVCPLPAAEVLAATARGSLEGLNTALADTPLELADPEIEEESPLDRIFGNNKWISIHTPEISLEDRLRGLNERIWGMKADPLLKYATPGERPRPSERKMRFAAFFGFVAFGLLAVAAAQNYGCAPDLSFLDLRSAREEPAKLWPPLPLSMPSSRYPASKQHGGPVQDQPQQLTQSNKKAK